MSDAAQGKRPPPPTYVDLVPVDKINELVVLNGDAIVNVRITRRGASGALSTCTPGRPMQTSRLLNIEQFCLECGGGASYEVYVKDPVDGKLLIPCFSFKPEGPFKEWYDAEELERTRETREREAAGRAAVGKPVNGLPASIAHLAPDQVPPHPQATGWYKSLPPIEQWRALGEPRTVEAGPHIQSPLMQGPTFYGALGGGAIPAPGAQLPSGAAHFSDALAKQHAEELRLEKTNLAAENARLQQKLDDEREQHRRDQQAVSDRLAAIEKKAQADVQASEIKSLERKMESMMAAASAPKPGLDLVALAAALSPLAVALLEGSRARDAQQMTTLTTALTAPKSSDNNDLLKILAPLAVPLIMKWIDGRSPEAQSKILETMFDAQQNNVALAAQVMQMMTQAQGGEQSPWVALVGQLIAGGGEVLNAYLEDKKKQAREAQQPPRLVHQGQPMPLPPPAAPRPAPVQVQVQAQPVQSATVSAPNGAAPDGAAGYGTLEETPPAAPVAAPAVVAPPAEVEHVGVPVDAAEANGAEDADVDEEDDGTPPTAEEVVEMFVTHPNVTPVFKTTPWRQIVFRLHSGEPQDAPALVAPAIVAELTKLGERGQLPDMLKGWRTTPSLTFNALVRFLPVYELYPEYAAELVTAMLSLVSEPADGLLDTVDDAPPS